jgi:hypothetical protein
MQIEKKIIVDEKGFPKEVVIPFEIFKEIEKMLGLDLEADTVRQLHEARKEREKGDRNAYVDLDDI